MAIELYEVLQSTGWRIDIRPDTETDAERDIADRERAERARPSTTWRTVRGV